jgi:hypothetical protein
MRAGMGVIARARVTVLAGTAVLTGTALLAAAAATAAPAAATVMTWTVRPGGKITATSGKITMTDTPTGAMIPCESSRMSGTLEAGSGLPGAGIGSLATATYSLCSGGPFPSTVTARGLPWRLNFTSYNRRTGVARGTISHLQIAFRLSPPACTAVIKGTSGNTPDGVAPVSYTSKTGILKILPTGGDLHWYHVHSCAGIIRNGDAATISASYAISPRQVITSP